MKTIETHSRAFLTLDNLAIDRVLGKVVPEGWAVTITAQPSGTTLVLGTNNNHLKKHGYRF